MKRYRAGTVEVTTGSHVVSNEKWNDIDGHVDAILAIIENSPLEEE